MESFAKTRSLGDLLSSIFTTNANAPADLVRSLGSAERYFEQIYEGRFTDELLQNARYAIHAKGPETMGNIAAWFEGDVLCFANDGLPFDEAAVKGICFVGMRRQPFPYSKQNAWTSRQRRFESPLY